MSGWHMSGWQNVTLAKCQFVRMSWLVKCRLVKFQVGEMSGWQNVTLAKCQVGKMSRWRNIRLAKCHVGKMSGWWNVRWVKCQVGKMSHWQNVRLAKCQVGEMSSWQNVRLAKCQVVRMSWRQPNCSWHDLRVIPKTSFFHSNPAQLLIRTFTILSPIYPLWAHLLNYIQLVIIIIVISGRSK